MLITALADTNDYVAASILTAMGPDFQDIVEALITALGNDNDIVDGTGRFNPYRNQPKPGGDRQGLITSSGWMRTTNARLQAAEILTELGRSLPGCC